MVVETSARGALERLRSRPDDFDLVLCDVMMPEIDGVELHASILRTVPAVLPRIVFITGGVFTDRARAFLEHVPNEVIEKPFDLARLRRLLERKLASVRPTAPPMASALPPRFLSQMPS